MRRGSEDDSGRDRVVRISNPLPVVVHMHHTHTIHSHHCLDTDLQSHSHHCLTTDLCCGGHTHTTASTLTYSHTHTTASTLTYVVEVTLTLLPRH